MNENPLVSIIIPVYNGYNYVENAIESALNQTYTNKEIIVVNDGSKDNGQTNEICKSFGNKIRYFIKENGGVSSALNLGIREMKGEYFSWLSHDDLCDNKKIEKLVSYVYNNPKSIIMCGTKFCDANGNAMKRKEKAWPEGLFTNFQVFEEIFKGKTIAGCALLVPRCAFIDAGFFNEQYRYMQDMDMWYRMFFKGYTLYSFNEKLSITRIHSNQLTVRDSKNNNEIGQSDANIIGKTVIDFLLLNKKFDLIKRYMFLCFRNHSLLNGMRCKEILTKNKKMNFLIQVKCMFIKTYGNMRPKLVNIYYKIKLRKN